MRKTRLTRQEWMALTHATDSALERVHEAIEKLRGKDAAENDEEMRMMRCIMARKLLELWTGKTAG